MPPVRQATPTTALLPAVLLPAALLLVMGNGGARADEPFGFYRLHLPEQLLQVQARDGGVQLVSSAGRSGMSYHRVVLDDGVVRLQATDPPRPPRRPADMLPDGEVSEGRANIARAWLSEPTRRYGHAVLGDAVEAAAISAIDRSGRTLHYRLGPESVFEDRRVRLVDVTGDGDDELLVVRSYRDAGAALALFAAGQGRLRLLAEAPPIGQPYRWLNPVGAADFDGDGRIEVAAVLTPHIGGTLAVYGLEGNRLVREYAAHGFSNHAMGSRELDLSAHAPLLPGGGEVLAVPDAERRALRLVSFAGGRFAELAVRAFPQELATAIVAGDLDGDRRAELVYGLSDGTLEIIAGN